MNFNDIKGMRRERERRSERGRREIFFLCKIREKREAECFSRENGIKIGLARGRRKKNKKGLEINQGTNQGAARSFFRCGRSLAFGKRKTFV